MTVLIGSLAEADPLHHDEAIVGILGASAIAAVLRYFGLRAAAPLRLQARD